MKLIKTPSRHTFRRITRLALAGLLLLSVILLPAGAQAGNAAAGKDPLWGSNLKNVPAWLKMADAPSQLYSEYQLTGLAGHLIANRVADASGCGGGGLRTDGSANKCGMERAFPALLEWQNRLNASIVATSDQTGVPPILLKNIFAWESQFWPQTVYVNTYEYGLGHITEMGADSALRWNVPFYDQICAASFSKATCQKSYPDQPENIRIALRGVVIQQVKADCSGCSYGLDMPLAERSIPVFAQTLLANASFVKWYIGGMTGHPAAESVQYEDLWKFTLTSYNAGPGCFMSAFSRTLGSRLTLDWKNLSAQLDPGCAGSRIYVDFISQVDHYKPANDPALLVPTPSTTLEAPAETPTATATATPDGSLAADVTATPTATATLAGTELTATPAPDSTGLPTDLSTPLATATEGTPLPSTVTPTSTEPGTASATATETETALPTATATAESLSVQLESPHVTNQVLVKINPANRQAALDTLTSLGISLSQDSSTIESLDTLVIQVEPAQLEAVLAALQASAGVEFAEPNYLVGLASTPNDPEFPRQGNLGTIQAPQTWDVLPGMYEVLVAVIDTGVDVNHPDLANNIWQNPGETGLDAAGIDKSSNSIDDDGNGFVDDWQGWNFVVENNNPADDHAHGTHLAGIIGATTNNAVGIAGVAPNARILPVKVLDQNGYGSYDQVANGIVYATDMGARVINLGFGGTGSSELLQNAVDYALARNVLVVASAGNDGLATTYFPAGYPGVLAVSAVDNNGYWANFSSSGDHISLAAPGLAIYSTTPGGFYRSMSGTSMASAHVSGVAALLAGQPQFGISNSLRSALIGGALDRGDPGKDSFFGYGIVQAYSSLAYAGPVLPVPTPWAVPTAAPGGGVYAMASEYLWARNSPVPPTCSFPTLLNSGNSTDLLFNDVVATCAGGFGGSASYTWQFTSFDDPVTLTSVIKATLDLRISFSGWVDDSYDVMVYDSTSGICGTSRWCNVGRFAPVAGADVYVPSSTLTTYSFDVSSRLNSLADLTAAGVRIQGRNRGADLIADPVTIAIDEIRILAMDTLPTATPTPQFIPTSTLPASRWMTATPVAGEPHNNLSLAVTDSCSTCHRSHTAQSFVLRSKSGEEQVCFTCHTSGGSGTNVQPAFTANTNSVTRFFSHGVAASLNIHLPEENTGASFGGANRHVECEDCHAPHSTARAASTGSVTAPSAQQEVYDSTGVDPTWTVLGAPTAYTWMNKADREYQICFKCHSSYTTLPTYVADGFGLDPFATTPGYITDGLGKLDNNTSPQIADSRDMAKEFNSYSVSFHPVAALGRNRNISAGSFVSGWSVNSILYCSDCHQNSNSAVSGEGPHGSSNLHLLDGTSNYITREDPNTQDPIHDAGELCFKCHQYNTYATGTNPSTTTNFRNGSMNLHAFHDFAACYTCHDTHGSEQDRLINFDTTVVTMRNGQSSQSGWQWNPTTGTGTCSLLCHNGEHNASSKTYTP